MKLHTPIRTLTKTINHPLLARWAHSSSVWLADHQTVLQADTQTEPSPFKLSRSSSNGKKFTHLVQELQQRSLTLIQAENIQIDPSLQINNNNLNNQKFKSVSGKSDGNDSTQPKRSRRKIRKNFDEDPEFKFDRKRGKRHIMIALKQSRLNPNSSAQSDKVHLVQELNLSIRSGGRLKKILLTLPPPPPNHQLSLPDAQSAPTSSSTSPLNKTVLNQPILSSQDQQIRPIDEFIDMYLGPLVWSNPQVDIALIYSQDQVRPKITFWNKEEGEDDFTTDEKKGVKEVEIKDSMSRSEILKLILDYQDNQAK